MRPCRGEDERISFFPLASSFFPSRSLSLSWFSQYSFYFYSAGVTDAPRRSDYLSLFCDLISARIKHRRTDVHLVAAEKAVCESCRERSWDETDDLLNYAPGLFRPSRCGFRAAKATARCRPHAVKFARALVPPRT